MDTPRKTERNRWIKPGHLERVIAACTRTEDAAIISLLARTGYRVDDIAGSTIDQWQKDHVTLTERKTGKKRSINQDKYERLAIEGIIDMTKARRHGTSWLLPARKRTEGKPVGHISRVTIWRIWRDAVRRAGLTGRGYTIHSLRKAYAVNLFEKTHSFEQVQRDLNHDRISTTMIYLADYFEDKTRNG